MTGRTHAFLGIASGLALSRVTGQTVEYMPWLGLAGLIGGLLPDMDHPQSIISGWLPFTGFLRAFVSHRGLTHTLLFWALVLGFIVIAYPTAQLVVIAVGVGVLSHLLADMLTPWGVPILSPVSNFNFTLLPRLVLQLISWLLEMIATLGSLAFIVWIVMGAKWIL